jgi:hypothetical protein
LNGRTGGCKYGEGAKQETRRKRGRIGDEMQVIRSDELPLSMIPKKKQIAHGVVPLCRGSVNAIANLYEKAATTERVASMGGRAAPSKHVLRALRYNKVKQNGTTKA